MRLQIHFNLYPTCQTIRGRGPLKRGNHRKGVFVRKDKRKKEIDKKGNPKYYDNLWVQFNLKIQFNLKMART